VVALSPKLARIAWAVMARGEDYRKPAVTAEPATT
jgi:transposase